VEIQAGVIRCSEAERRRRRGIALAAAVALAPGLSRPQMAGAAAKGGDAMTNWASDVITETASASGRDPVEANRVTLTVAGGPVVVQWSLSYDAYVTVPFQDSGRSASVGRIQSFASLERDGVEIARWKLADQTLDLSLPSAQLGSRDPRAACSSTARPPPGPELTSSRCGTWGPGSTSVRAP
jgi:hypothetical protein